SPLRSPSWASEITSFTPRSPRLTRLRRNAVQKGPSSDGPASTPRTCRPPPPPPPRRHPLHAPVLTPLVVRRINPHVRVLASDLARAKRLDLRVELDADPRDLRFRHPVHPQRLQQIVHLPRGHAVHVGLLDHRLQRSLRSSPRLEQRGKVAPRTHLRNRQLDRAHPRVPASHPVPVAVCASL